jgi:transcriptional regulator with XRE-family HTH domain
MIELRNEKGLKKTDVAKGTGLSRSAITMYENGVRDNPTLPILKRIASFFDISLDYLTGNSNIKDKDISNKTLTDIFGNLDDSNKIELVKYAKYLLKEQEDGKSVSN